MKLTIVALCVFLPSFLPAVFAGQKLGKQTLVDSSLPEPDAAARESRHFSLLAVEEIHPTNKDTSYRAYLKIHEDKVGTWESDDAEFALYEGALVGKPEAASQGWKYACVRETGAKQGLLSLTRTGRSGREGVPGCTAWNEFNLETVDSVVEEEN
ncbi:hypothetical protein FRC03_004834 [Tulasnella sp. 419]|nr:hypothetical protein FRC03_004834 [Tulasnella sp. 419]